jgi:hypothetical protein
MLKPKQGGLAMPTGLFRATDQSAQVEYDGVSIPIPRSTYEKNGYKPPKPNSRNNPGSSEPSHAGAVSLLGEPVEMKIELEGRQLRRPLS